MTTDTTALQERIRRAFSIPAEWARRRDGETTMEQAERWQKRQDEQIAALIAAEVQAAKAEALRETARDMGEWAGEWIVVGGEDDEDSRAVLTVGEWLTARADEHETGDRA